MPYIDLESGKRVEVFMSNEQGKRLSGTCFRGLDCRQAGNFFQWPDFLAFIQDKDVQRHLRLKLAELIRKANVNKAQRFELQFGYDIGWDSVMAVENLTEEDMASCTLKQLNRRGCAFFLPEGKIWAPKTDALTMVVRQRHVEHWQFFIQTIYPGHDVGKMAGNMTEQFGLVWLPWNNPGE